MKGIGLGLGLGLIHIAWYAFVFAMCYFFSPWFALLLIVTPRYRIVDDDKESDKKI